MSIAKRSCKMLKRPLKHNDSNRPLDIKVSCSNLDLKIRGISWNTVSGTNQKGPYPILAIFLWQSK
jgi:hypothetical protein